MKSIVGLVTPERGQILFDGRNVLAMNNDQKKDLRQEIGMLFQGSALFDSETVLGNVMFPLVMFSKMTKAEMRDRALFCIERVNVEENDVFAYAEHGIHVVRVDYGGYAIFMGYVAEQFVNDYGCAWIKAGVRFVAKKIFRIQGYCPRYCHSFANVHCVVRCNIYRYQCIIYPYGRCIFNCYEHF